MKRYRENGASDTRIKVLIADDHRLVREGIRLLLGSCLDIEVVAEAENGRHALEQLAVTQPDLVVMDIGMPELNGIEATRQVVLRSPRTKVVILSCHADEQRVLAALKAGATVPFLA